jgi:cysteine synthase
MDILRAIGNTSLVRLRKVVPAGCAELTLIPSEGGLSTKALFQEMVAAAQAMSQAPHTHWSDQLNNRDSIAGYFSLGEEIWTQTQGAMAMAPCLAQEEALFAGTSSGANVVAAIQVAQRLGPAATVVTLMVDSGLEYLNTDVFKRN